MALPPSDRCAPAPPSSLWAEAALGLSLIGMIAVLVVLATDGDGATFGGASARPPGDREKSNRAHGPCRVAERSRSYLRLFDGRYAYVEPHALLRDGSGFLIAGQPTYAAIVDSVGRGVMGHDPDFLGVRVHGDEVSTIGRPIGVEEIGWTKGMAVAPARWRFLFDRLEPGGTPGDAPAGVVYAELDDGEWALVEEVPVPLQSTSHGALAASVLGGGRPAFTIVVDRRGGGRDVVLWRRAADGWQPRVVWERWVDEVAAQAWGGRVRVALSGLDPTLSPKRPSVRTWELDLDDPRPDGPLSSRIRRHTVAAGSERFYQPIPVGGERLDVGWLEAGEGVSTASVTVDALGPTPSGPFPLEERSVALAGLQLGEASLWIVYAVADAPGAGRLSFFTATSSGIRYVGSLDYPFVGPFGALVLASGEIVVIGAEADFRPTSAFVRSLVLRLDIECT